MKVIFVHGMCATGMSWNDFHLNLAKEFEKPEDGGPTFHEPLTLTGIDPEDQIGFQELSQRDVYNASEKTMADWVNNVIDAFPDGDARDVCLIGHSQGGSVISHVADAKPDRIARLIFIAAMLPIEGQNAEQIMGKAQDDINCEFAIRDFARLVGIGGMVRQPKLPTEASLTLEDEARQLSRCYLLTELDGVLPIKLQKRMVKAYDDDEMPVTTDSVSTGHFPQFENQSELVSKLVPWIPN